MFENKVFELNLYTKRATFLILKFLNRSVPKVSLNQKNLYLNPEFPNANLEILNLKQKQLCNQIGMSPSPLKKQCMIYKKKVFTDITRH